MSVYSEIADNGKLNTKEYYFMYKTVEWND